MSHTRRVTAYAALAMVLVALTASPAPGWYCIWEITPPPGPLPPGDVGLQYEVKLSGENYNYDYVWTVIGSLPPGLVLDDCPFQPCAYIRGVPQLAGNYAFTIQCENLQCGIRTVDYTLEIRNTCAVTIDPPTLPPAVHGQSYQVQLVARNGIPPYQWSVFQGSLPPGLTLQATGLIEGVPTRSGDFPFTVAATDSRGCAGYAAYVLHVDCSLALPPATLPEAIEAASYSATIPSAGGAPPVRFRPLGGTVPPGLQLSSWGTLQGVPAQAGWFTMHVEAYDVDLCTAVQSYPLPIRSRISYLAGPGAGPGNANRVRAFEGSSAAPALDFAAYAAGGWGTRLVAARVEPGLDDTIVTGPGPGASLGPQVRGFDKVGLPLSGLNYFAQGTLRYGVNPGRSDVDRDGLDEILTGPGPGVVFGPHVRGWDYDYLKPSVAALPGLSFFAYGTLKYGVGVAGGALAPTGDDEVLTGAGPGPSFGAAVRGWSWTGSRVVPIAGLNFVAFPGQRYGVNIVAGDAQGDGEAELLAASGPGPTQPSRVRGFAFGGAGVASLPGYDATPFPSLYGARPGEGDLDGNGRGELLVGAGPDPASTGEILVFAYDGVGLQLTAVNLVAFPYPFGVSPATGLLGY